MVRAGAGLTDDVENVDAVADDVESLPGLGSGGSVERVDVLPFPRWDGKWAEVIEEYNLADTRPPAPELIERVHAQFTARALATSDSKPGSW